MPESPSGPDDLPLFNGKPAEEPVPKKPKGKSSKATPDAALQREEPAAAPHLQSTSSTATPPPRMQPEAPPPRAQPEVAVNPAQKQTAVETAASGRLSRLRALWAMKRVKVGSVLMIVLMFFGKEAFDVSKGMVKDFAKKSGLEWLEKRYPTAAQPKPAEKPAIETGAIPKAAPAPSPPVTAPVQAPSKPMRPKQPPKEETPLEKMDKWWRETFQVPSLPPPPPGRAPR